jgi:hypothetical protein
MSFIRAFIFDNVQIQISNDWLAFNDRPAPKPPSNNNNVQHAHQSLIKSNGLPDIEKAESAMDQCHCCKQWFFRIEAHYAKSDGACFPEPLTGGRCKRSRSAKIRKQVESNDSSDDTDSMLGTEVEVVSHKQDWRCRGQR